MNTPRDCSFHFPNHKSVICHSARHRSTFRLSADATKTVFPKNGNPYQRAHKGCRDAFRAFWYWSKQEQASIDAFIEAIEEERGWARADKEACQASRPGWTFTARRGRFGGIEITATRADGAFQIRHAADSWREIHHVTK